MKLLVLAAVLGVCLGDTLNRYLPPRGNSGAGGEGPGFGVAGTPGFGHSGAGNFGARGGNAGNPFGSQYSGNVYNAPSQYNAGQSQYGGSNARGGAASADANAQILRQNSEVTAEGFSYDFETSNGIRADAQGVATNGVQSQGSFAYKGDDGQEYSIQYTADENGYQPRGAHLPTPPPIPEAILKSLEQNARDEAAGITDDGTYRGEGAGSGGYSGSGYNSNSQNAGYSAQKAGYSGQNAGYSGQNAGYSGQNAVYSGQSAGAAGSYSGASSFSGSSSFGGRQSGFGGFGNKVGAGRQTFGSNAGARGSGNGNFNQQTGYQY